MIHLRSHFIGCKNDGRKPTIDGHVIRLDHKSMWAYANVLNVLADACHLAYSLKDVTNKPFKVTIFLPSVKYRKSIDKCSNLDVLNFFITKLKPPPNGIIFDIFQISMNPKYITPFFLANVWPFIDKWNPQDWISVQLPEKNLSSNKLEPLMQEWEKLKPILDSYTNITNIRYVDYSMDISYVYETIMGTKLHISYTGASYWIAGNAKVPMIAFGPQANKKIIKEYDSSHKPVTFLQTQYGVHSKYYWCRNYDIDTEEPVSNYNHLIYNIEHIKPNIKETIDALANLQSGDRDMWFM